MLHIKGKEGEKSAGSFMNKSGNLGTGISVKLYKSTSLKAYKNGIPRRYLIKLHAKFGP